MALWRYHIFVRYLNRFLTFTEYLTSGRATSIATILAGSIYYTWLKHLENATPKAKGYDNVPLEEVEAGKANGNGRAV